MLATIVLVLWPVAYQTGRAIIALAIPALVIGLAILLREKRTTSNLLITGLCAMALFLIFPGRDFSRDELRESYVRELHHFAGVRYVWGGENCFGIDCSGLVRKGLINAEVKTGLVTLNPRLARQGLDLWWHDCSATALREQYRNFTTKLFEIESINILDAAKIRPGDIAVTSSGMHVMAYIGGKNWIEADPGPHKVLVVETPSENFWFKQPMYIMRWRNLE